MFLKFTKIDISTPIAIYGPEGCGKTELFKYLVHRFKILETL